MSLTLALQSALSGLQLNQQALNTLSSNIANVNTPGYTRKILGQQSRVIGNTGVGVQTTQLRRQVSDVLIRDFRKENTVLGLHSARHSIISRTQEFYGAPGDNSALNARINLLADSFAAIAVNPEDNVAQLDFLTNAQMLARDIRRLSLEMQKLRSDSDREIATTVNDINTLLGQIRDVNNDIANGLAQGRSTAEFEDRRDELVSSLSSLVNINTYTDGQGRININIAGITVLDRHVRPLSYTPSVNVSPSTNFSPIEVDGTDISGNIYSGRLKGFMEVRDTDIPNMAAQLDQLSRMLYEEVNASHNRGTAFPPPQTLNGATQGFLPTDAFTATGTIRIAITDQTGALVAVYERDLATIPDANAPAGIDIQDLIDDINASLGPGVASLGADGQMILNAGPNQGIGMTELSPVSIAGSTRGFSHFFGLNNLFTANEAVTNPGEFALGFALESRFNNTPGLIARGILSQDPGPLAVGTNVLAAGDGDNAEALSDVFNRTFTFPASGGLSSITRTLSDYGAALITHSANETARVESDMQVKSKVVEGIAFNAAQVSAVNLDEELSRIIIYEQAYNASAQVIRTANDMFDSLLSIAR